MKSKYLIESILLVIVGLFFSYCSKMNDLHDQYLEEGEKIYVGQPDSAKVLPGVGRAMIHYWISDPKATKLMVYWNSGEDSVLVDIPGSPGTSAKQLLISDLEERMYYFQLVTMNSELKNRSIPMETSGHVYGPKFQKTLIERNLKYATFQTQDTVFTQWGSIPEYYMKSEIKYKNKAGNYVTKFITSGESSLLLEGFSGEFEFRTLYLPEEEAYDTLYSNFISVNRIDSKMDNSLITRWNPPGIPYFEHSSSYGIEKMWDDNVGTWYIQSGITLPHSFTFDLGEEVKLSRIKQWQRLTAGVVYRSQGVKKFEVWGSTTPDVSDDFSEWTVLGVYESIKPSRQDLGKESPEDLEYAAAGEDFMILNNTTPVRYIRYVVKDTWNGAVPVTIGELSFFSIND